MATTTTTLANFLKQHKSNDKKHTHTRIGDKRSNIYGGAYLIEGDDLNKFYELYYNHVIVNKQHNEYLTEKQPQNGSTIAVDLDFRYDYKVTERQHNKDDVETIVCLYLSKLKEIFVFNGNSHFHIFVMEKPNVNRVQEKNVTKDGIHMLINIKADHNIQQLLRKNVLNEFDLDLRF